MIIAQILSPVHSLGPGERICLWTQGCSKNCYGCISPEFQTTIGSAISNNKLAELIIKIAKQEACTGFTISGGDPFEQADDLLELLKLTRNQFSDILVYTGYSIEEIYNEIVGKSGVECLDYIDVLIDGRYIKKLNTSDCILRGSSNQKIYFLNQNIEQEYLEYMKKGRIIETFIHDNKTILTGILNEE